MVKLTGGEYPFLYEISNPENKINNSNPTSTDNNNEPIIEGIADFCAANRAYGNQFNQGWNNLAAAINNVQQQLSSSSAAQETNTGIQTGASVDDLNPYKATCSVTGTVYESANDKASSGFIRAYSTDGQSYRGSIRVDTNGKFNKMNIKLIDNSEKYIFVYEDANGDSWEVTIGTTGNTETSCQSGEYTLYKTATKMVVGYGRDSRDASGKLKNTEQKNSGAELRYNGMKSIYAETIANTVNLGVGILIAIAFIAKSQ